MDANNSYIAQRLAAIGAGNTPSELDALKAENARLKQLLEQAPPANFKSEAQRAFEQSPEFEAIMNAYFMRFLRERHGAEFKSSPYNAEFQTMANSAFERFETNLKKEAPKNGQTRKADNDGAGKTDAGKNA